ncbi:Exonuclease mut-7 like protein [Argiope bruennichi]|uniref:Exonuclease mut-7 like protein n=1 Tax=Argiope bruennichi TaxID=94029 RepID=A0A8T0G0B2_ARGBR|nr:Exonuclease mut-7 like protein [Argiope bruennichi]
MFCYCRLLRRALTPCNRVAIPCLHFAPSNHGYTVSSSTKTDEIIQEKKFSLHVIQEINNLEFSWRKQRNGKHFKSLIYKYFSKVEGSTSDSVDLLRAACDKTRCHHELIYSLLATLNDAIIKGGVEFNPSLEEKIEALKSVLIYSNYDLIQEVCKIFKINETNHKFKELVDSLLMEQKLVEAAYCIGTLNLQHEYDVEKVLFPILLEGKLFPVKQCIQKHPHLQLNIAKKLDSLLISEDNVSRTTKFSINSKRIIKILNKWVKWFKIPTELCPNFHHVRSRAAINVLIKRRAEQSVSENVWEDMVMTIIGESASLKEHLIYKLMQQNDKETALKMVKKLNMNDFDVTKLNLTEEETDLENIADKDDLEDLSKGDFEVEDKSEHLMFNLSASDIKYIDNASKFTDFLNEILNYDIVGIDTEWKPHFGLSAERLALMQIAVRDKVYILDMVYLRDCLAPEHWDGFMKNLFGNSNIIKLGCGIMNDVQMIIEDSKGTKGKKIGFTHILDMSVFYNKLQDIYPDEIHEETREKKNIGLSKLCELILGLPLNKEERLCDWEKRPLAESQLEYAALDALCLVQMYDKLKLNAAEKNMNFDHLVNVSMYLTASMWKPKKRIKGMKFEKDIQIRKPIPIHQFKVVVDSAFESQAKQLRQLGADVVILNKSDSPETAARISKDEDRILICSVTLFRRIEHLRPNAFCFKPFNKYGEPEPISSILHKFNIQLSAKRILSRCEACNSEESIKLSSKDINFLQDCIKNQDFTALNSVEEINNFQRTLIKLIESGINIKFKPEMNYSHTEKPQAFLCTKCGTVQ